MSCISLRGISKSFEDCSGGIHALKSINIEIEYGEFVSLIGPSGSGKSTLLNLISGLDYPSEGEIWIRNQNIADLDSDELVVFRRRNIGAVYQNFNLLDVFDVKNNITFPVELDGTKVDDEYIKKICRILNIHDRMDAMPNELSGGEQQRVAIARALAVKPVILLADEPTGNLDVKAGLDVLALLKNMNEELGQTVVMVTHNLEAAQLAERMITITDGRIAEV